MRFLPFLLLALAATTAPTTMAAAPSHLHRMITKGYATKPPPTEPPTEAPTTEAPTYPPTEAPTYPPTEEPTYPPTEAPTTSAPTTVYYPPTDAPTEPPTLPAPTQLTWCHHEIIASTEDHTIVESDLHDWMNTFLQFFGLDGTSTDYLMTSLIPDAIDGPAVGNCTYPYVTTVDAYVRITLPSDIYPDFAIRYNQYQLDHPWSIISSTTCGAVVELDETCTNGPTVIVPTTNAPTTATTTVPTTATTTTPTTATTTAPTSKTTSTPTTKTTTAPTTKPTTKTPTTKAPTARAPTQKPTTKVPTSAPTSSTITITTNITQPDPNTRCIAGVCVSINSATSTHIAIIPVIASIVALIMAAF